MQCSLCRSGRQGSSTLRKALQRQVDWPQPNTGLVNPIQVYIMVHLGKLTSLTYCHGLRLQDSVPPTHGQSSHE